LPTTPATPAPPEGGSNLGVSYHVLALDSLLMSIVSNEISVRRNRSLKNEQEETAEEGGVRRERRKRGGKRNAERENGQQVGEED